ncbi:MerR family transcriptional regulator [Roseibium sediminicola]|uniref:MerR family transcriptional regulator n=1 Tax=Roseibium sediminicola TaxID=2933272 RepID=A0ABT0H2Q2_9HYPH|nr:MerR family transcriptional regulator [Roseibium sp. CAU 1639]MCK7615750.1 MerR family transcriptional regulator [Roseibium sp. CAU 1639]
MKIAEVAEDTGLSISTIRFYEKSGLCPPIQRGRDGKRRFSANDADWLALLASLRATGMSMSQMRAFAALYASGDETVPQRKAVLLRHRKSLEIRQTELDRCRAILDRKLKRYEEILEVRE